MDMFNGNTQFTKSKPKQTKPSATISASFTMVLQRSYENQKLTLSMTFSSLLFTSQLPTQHFWWTIASILRSFWSHGSLGTLSYKTLDKLIYCLRWATSEWAGAQADMGGEFGSGQRLGGKVPCDWKQQSRSLHKPKPANNTMEMKRVGRQNHKNARISYSGESWLLLSHPAPFCQLGRSSVPPSTS